MDHDNMMEMVGSGRAKVTWAVFQFPDDAKLLKLQKDGDLKDFMASLSDEDPYVMRELPAIGGVKQFIVMGRENKLPFNEEGLTKKQGEDEMARALAREQLAIIMEKYPHTTSVIQQGLAKAETASCKSCVEKRLLEHVLQQLHAEKKSQVDRPIRDKTPSVDEEQWGSREPCPLCTLKHLGQAIVLFNESIMGYPSHRWIAVGHLAEAEAESPTHDIANRIREQRLEAMDNVEYIPQLTGILAELDAIVMG